MKSDSKRPFLTEKKFADGLIAKQLAPDSDGGIANPTGGVVKQNKP
jgi:hypothetical protein